MVQKKGNTRPVVIAVAAVLVVWILVIAAVLLFLAPRIMGVSRNFVIDRRLELGRRYLSEMEYEKAVTMYSGVVRIDDRNTEAYVGLGDAYTGLLEWTPAVQNYDEAVITVTGVLPQDSATEEEIGVLISQAQVSEDSYTEDGADDTQPVPEEEAAIYDGPFIMDVIVRRDSALEMGLQEMAASGADAAQMRGWLDELGHSDYTPEDPEIDELIHDPEALQEEAAPAEEMIPEETEPDPGPPARDWIGIYSSFILDGGYWNSGEEYWGDDRFDSVKFAIYDLDQNDVPELIAFNNGPDMATMTNYIYTCQDTAPDEEIRFLGNAGIRGFGFVYAPDSAYTGLFTEGGNMGYFTGEYFTIENGELHNEHVLDSIGDYSGSEPVYTDEQYTEDDVLFDTFSGFFPDHYEEKGLRELIMYSVDEIESMGWEAFLSAYGYEY